MRNFLLFLFLAHSVLALPCVSNSNGDWTAPSTWINCNGGVPGNGDTAKIMHAVTVSTTVTVGTSQQDSLTVAPNPAIEVDNTNGTTSNGFLTLGNGAVLNVRGSVLWVGSGAHAPVLTINQDALWVFDQSVASDPTTAYYRNYATANDSFTMLRTVGAAGHRVTIRGKPAACATCAPAIWSTELNLNSGTGRYSTFSHDYVRTDFYDFGSATDVYRSAYFACSDIDHLSGQQMHMVEVTWNNSSGFDSSGSNGYPCSYTDFNVQYFQSFSSTTATSKGFWDIRPIGVPAAGKTRSVSYVYLDRGLNSGGGNVTFNGFQKVSYVVADGQYGTFGPSISWSGSAAPDVDHMLVRVATNSGGQAAFYGSTTYMLTVHEGNTGNVHSVFTVPFSGGYDWVLDHVIWQHGDATGASDTDAYSHATGSAISTATWNNMLILPNAAQPGYTSHTINVGGTSPTKYTRFNHMVMAFGNNYGGSASGIVGALYYGESTPCGIAGSVPYLKNSILWNPNPTANHNPVFALAGGGACTTSTLANNEFTPVGITNNDVFNWGTVSRWVNGTSCGSGCTSNGTPYDYPASGSVPGANDLHLDPLFVWQVQRLVAAGPREWANIVHGADITSGETSTEVHFATTFALFANATINDTTTVAGLKGLVDEMFTWIYGEWSSTQPSLQGAADDGSDIGASPVVSTCPTVYPGSIWPACNTIASTRHFFKRD